MRRVLTSTAQHFEVKCADNSHTAFLACNVRTSNTQNPNHHGRSVHFFYPNANPSHMTQRLHTPTHARRPPTGWESWGL